MSVIGERINGMFTDVKKAIQAQDPAPIQQLARDQVAAGANALDINVGPASSDKLGAMRWLVEITKEVVDVPLCIDTTNAEVMKAGLEAAEGNAIINSTTGEEERMEKIVPLATEYDCPLIGLTIDAEGVPRDANGRMEVAMRIVQACMEQGIAMTDLYIDAVILPVNALQQVPQEVLNTLRMCKALSDPPPQTVIGLSNVSQGALHRELINRIYLVMALANGLDAAIMDPLDTELMDAAITAEVLLNRSVYCDDFLKAYRK